MSNVGDPTLSPFRSVPDYLPVPTAPSQKLTRKGRIILLYIGLFVLCILSLLPLLWMVSTSLKTPEQVSDFPPKWIPKPIAWSNYEKTWNNDEANFPLWTRNTLIIAGLSAIGMSISSSIVAYGFAKIQFRGRGLLFALMLSTMMIPYPVIMSTLFVIFRKLGDITGIAMTGTQRPLWIPAWFGSAFSIFLLRQFFMTIPDELSEAARIDGCNEWGIYWRVILPLSKPALTAVALFTFIGAWRDFLAPLVYLQWPQQYTLTIGLAAFQSENGNTPYNYLMAATFMVILPIIILFFLAQKTFIEGIATTGMKG